MTSRRMAAGTLVLLTALSACGSSKSSSPLPHVTPTSTASASICPPSPTWNPDTNSLQVVLPPVPPTVAVDAGKLVPTNRTPTEIVLCRYTFDRERQASKPLGTRTITGIDAAIKTFAAEKPVDRRPRHCPAILMSDTGYLVDLVYPDGVVWLVSPGHNVCEGTGNGVMVSGSNDAGALDKAFRTGTWAG